MLHFILDDASAVRFGAHLLSRWGTKRSVRLSVREEDTSDGGRPVLSCFYCSVSVKDLCLTTSGVLEKKDHANRIVILCLLLHLLKLRSDKNSVCLYINVFILICLCLPFSNIVLIDKSSMWGVKKCSMSPRTVFIKLLGKTLKECC